MSETWKLDNECVFITTHVPGYGDAPLLEVRGWGRLTKFQGLSEEKALEEQLRVGTLAATAPELLDALQRLLRVVDSSHPDAEFARAAVAKATLS